MVTIKEAIATVKKNLPDGNINAAIRWKDDWVFSVYMSDPDEGELDPFYAVNAKTGAFSGYSIVGDNDTNGILSAFENAIEHGNITTHALAHYGVKGMKWGVRRSDEELARARGKGPSSASVAAESFSNAVKPFAGMVLPRAAIAPKIMQTGRAVAEGMAKAEAAKAAFIGPQAIAGYAVTGLDSGAYRVPVVAAKNLARGGWNKDSSLADKNMNVDQIQKKVVSQINKNYPGLGTTNNCLRCTYAYEMRRRGNDVAATKTMMASGQTKLGTMVMTKSFNATTGKVKRTAPQPKGLKRLVFGKAGPTPNDIFKALEKQPDRSRGDLQMQWGFGMGGHSVAYEIVKGKPVIFDTQSGKTYSSPQALASLTGKAKQVSFNRLDNKSLNELGLTAWMKDNK